MTGRAAAPWTLVSTILASGLVFLDSTVVNIALPAIDASLDAGLSGLQWTVDGYLLTLAALMLPGGAAGDRLGRRRVMLVGLAGFGIASIGCGLAPNTGTLVAARMAQGAAGALLVPGSLALLRAAYTDEAERGRAIGRWSGWSGITTVIGPLAGGWLVDAVSWRAVFFINPPIVAATMWMLWRHVPESRAPARARGLDPWGAALAITGLAGLAYALIEGPVAGWTAPLVVAAALVGIAAVGAWPVVEHRVAQPMMPLSLFRSRDFAGANLTTVGVYFALYGLMFLLVVYLQNVLGYSALEAGLALSPPSFLMLALSPLAGRLAATAGARWFMLGGPLLIAASLVMFARLSPATSYWSGILPGMLVFGTGLAATVAPLTNVVVSAAPERHAGVAAAFNNVVTRVAALLAVAGLGAFVSTGFRAELAERRQHLGLPAAEERLLDDVARDPTGQAPSGLSPAAERAVHEAFSDGFGRAMLFGAALAAAGGLAAALLVRQGERTG